VSEVNGSTNVVVAGRQRTTCIAKASLTSCQAHAFFYKESSTASSSELNLDFCKRY
jgi:hypothetical protein